jgi:hypothetical protein
MSSVGGDHQAGSAWVTGGEMMILLSNCTVITTCDGGRC